MTGQVPLVDYLVLGDEPHLVAHECTTCGARFFDRRNACASCSGTEFRPARSPPGRGARLHDRVVRRAGHRGALRGRRGRLWRHQRAGQPDQRRARPRARAHRHEGAPGHVRVGTDDDGTEAIGFGFEPID